MARTGTFYDIVGVGFGPANIALAVALEEAGFKGSALFLERNPGPDWQGEMLLDGSDIQHNPLRDFVTPRNPRSAYGFISYLHAEGRLFDYLNLDIPFALRKDYSGYIRWVARHFDRWVNYGEGVEAVLPLPGGEGVEVRTTAGRTVRARALSLGPGRSPLIPAVFAPHMGDRVVHFTRYRSSVARWSAGGEFRSVAVVGASQSAVEIVLDLARSRPDLKVHGLQRGFGFRLKDTSPFTEKAYTPPFVDYFFRASEERQRAMTADLWRSNYSAADADVIHQLHLALYEQKLDGGDRLVMHEHTEIADVETGPDGVTLRLVDRNHGTRDAITVDAVILATGFRNFGAGPDQELFHPLLSNLAPLARRRGDGSIDVARDYRLEPSDPAASLPLVFVNGLCESTHGFGDAGSFSLLALRSWTIATAILDGLSAARAGAHAA